MTRNCPKKGEIFIRGALSFNGRKQLGGPHCPRIPPIGGFEEPPIQIVTL